MISNQLTPEVARFVGTAWLAAALGLGALLGLLRSRRKLAGTTLIAPWCWAMFSLAVVAGSETICRSQSVAPSTAWLSHIRYLAATTTFCPFMALLGAKRPQNRAWQFIVLALLTVLALPAVEGLLFRPHA